ncbi:MAG: DUF4349 domain-containing protein [Acidobacteriota bacterium]
MRNNRVWESVKFELFKHWEIFMEKNMKVKISAIFLLSGIILSACSQYNSETSSNTNANMVAMMPSQNERLSNASSNSSARKISLEQSEQSQNAPVVVERKIIRNADLTLEANSPEEAQQQISSIVDSKGGFVIESKQSSSDVQATTRDTVTMTLRVPAEKFDETLNEIRKTSSRVIVETVKGEDVTEEFIDIEARLKTKKALEEQFLEIMKRSNSVEDALNVQRELAEVRGEIEQIEGRKRFLENQASLSTIKISLQSPTAFSANSSGFFYQLKESVGNGYNAALNFILVLVTILIALLPFLLLVVLPIYLILRYFWRKREKRNLASEIARDEIKVE